MVAVLDDIRVFTLPLLVVWLSAPLMSVIDTAVVGISSGGVLHLAALGPGVTMCDNLLYVLMSVAIVVTNKVATAEVRFDAEAAAKAVEDGLAASIVLGLAAATFVTSRFGTEALAIISGHKDSAAASTVASLYISKIYSNIRAIAFVPALMMWVCQAACLARRDVRTPLRAVGFASVLNILADYTLVFRCGYGTEGAAWATVIAQTSTCALLLWNETKHRRSQRARPQINTSSSSTKSTPLDVSPLFQTGSTYNSSDRSIYERAKATCRFVFACISPACALLAKAVALVFLTLTASACEGRHALAAHQVLYSVYCLFCPIGEALSQTVQSLLPAALLDNDGNSKSDSNDDTSIVDVSNNDEEESTSANLNSISTPQPMSSSSTPSKSRPETSPLWGSREIRVDRSLNRRGCALIKYIGAMGMLLSLADAAFAGALPVMLPHLFTRSPAVIKLMAHGAPTLSLCLAMHALSNILEGILFATKDEQFFSCIYPTSSIIVVILFLRQRNTSISPGLNKVWGTFVIYQALRFAQCFWRVLQNQSTIIPDHKTDEIEPKRENINAETSNISKVSVSVPSVRGEVQRPRTLSQETGATSPEGRIQYL